MPVSGYVLPVLSETQISRNLKYHIKLLLSHYIKFNWLVVWKIFYCPFHIWDNPSHWLIFFKMVKTTNQKFNISMIASIIVIYPLFHRIWLRSWWIEPCKIPCWVVFLGIILPNLFGIMIAQSRYTVYHIPYTHYSPVIQQFAIEKSKFWICKSLS